MFRSICSTLRTLASLCLFLRLPPRRNVAAKLDAAVLLDAGLSFSFFFLSVEEA